MKFDCINVSILSSSMKDLKNKIILLFVILFTSLSFTSCDDPYDPYYDLPPIIGDWQLVESNGFGVSEYDADYYTFYQDGRGTLGYYDRYDRWVEEWFDWEIRYRNELYIYYDSRYLEPQFCYFDYDGRYMYFSPYSDFVTYNVYARTRW